MSIAFSGLKLKFILFDFAAPRVNLQPKMKRIVSSCLIRWNAVNKTLITKLRRANAPERALIVSEFSATHGNSFACAAVVWDVSRVAVPEPAKPA